MPVHGEIRHLIANGDLAKATGVPDKRVILGADGVVVDLVDGVATIMGQVECGYVFVDGSSVGEITEDSLHDRRVLGEEGFISVIIVLDAEGGRIVAGPTIQARGFAESDVTFDAIKPGIVEAVNALLREGVLDSHTHQQAIRRVIGRWVSNTHRRRPMILPVVMQTTNGS